MSIKQSKSLKEFNKLHPEVRINAGKKSSVTKLSLEGNKRLREALLKCKDKRHNFPKGQKPHNYIPEYKKPKVKCLNCGKICIVTPIVAKTKKYCSKKCMIEYRTGRPHINWNPNSFHSKSGKGIAGEYKGIRFRSSFELSFIKAFLNEGHNIKAEPFRIKLITYLNKANIAYYKIKDYQHYSPDFLLDNKWVIEIKPERMLMIGQNIAKMQALDNYCKQNNLKCGFLTEEGMKDIMLNYDDIKNISDKDIIFYKRRDNERFKQTKC